MCIYFLLVYFLTSNGKFYIYIYIYIFLFLSLLFLVLQWEYQITSICKETLGLKGLAAHYWCEKIKHLGDQWFYQCLPIVATLLTPPICRAGLLAKTKIYVLPLQPICNGIHTYTHTDIATYRLNWPRGHYSKKYLHIYNFFSLLMNIYMWIERKLKSVIWWFALVVIENFWVCIRTANEPMNPNCLLTSLACSSPFC